MKSVAKEVKTIITKTVSQIQKEIQELAKPSNKTAIEKYMKNVQTYRGVKTPELKGIVFKSAWDEHMKDMTPEDKKEIAHILLSQAHGEDKYIGMMLFDRMKKHVTHDDVKRIEKLFKDGTLVGWANTDTVCGYIFKHWVTGNVDNMKYVCGWKNSDCLWLQRASCVTFVTLAKHGDKAPNFTGFMKMLDETCERTIQNQERFAQLGTGWLLRNIGTADKKQLFDFLERNMTHFSREGLSYAIEKLNATEKKRFVAMRTKSELSKLEEEVEEEALPEEKTTRKRRK